MNEAELRVLAGFFPATKNITIKELEQKSDYSYERVYSSLKKLKEYGAVMRKKVGKILTFHWFQRVIWHYWVSFTIRLKDGRNLQSPTGLYGSF